jgi:hypothetical protein
MIKNQTEVRYRRVRGNGNSRKGIVDGSDSVDKVISPAADAFAAKITASWQKAVESILETGRLLIEAKEGPNKLPHGEFGKMF